MATPRLGALPPELLLSITDFILRPADLRALCLTCCALRTAAMPKLYHSVTIDLTETRLPSLNGFFVADNPGTAYTKCMAFTGGDIMYQSSAWKIMTLAFQCLRTDCLEEVRLPSQFSIDLGILLSLSKTQRKLKRVHLGSLGNALQAAQDCPMYTWDWARKLEEISTPFSVFGVTDLDAYREIIQHTHKLTHLDLQVGRFRNMKGLKVGMRDTANTEGSLMKALFSHVAPETPLSLSSLTLGYISLQHSTNKLTRVIDFEGLTHLALYNCTGGDVLLSHLTSSSTFPSMALQQFLYAGPALSQTVVEAFLKSFGGLQSLALRYEGHCLIDMSCLARHGESMRRLFVHMRDEEDINGDGFLPVTKKQVSAVCQHCTWVTELGVVMPSIEVLGPGMKECCLPFIEALAAVSQLQHLRMLRIMNWPSFPADTFVHNNGDLDDDAYLPCHERINKAQVVNMMDAFASWVFGCFAHSRNSTSIAALPILSFGVANAPFSRIIDSDSNRVVDMEPLSYLAVTQTDRYGSRSIKAERIPDSELQYV